MRRGGRLPDVRIAYETWGEPNAHADNVVLLLTGLSPDAHAASSPADPRRGWWEAMVGPGKPLDAERFFIICVNALGSCFGSTGPASVNPVTGEPYGSDFPELALEDLAASARWALSLLGIRRLRAVVGPSLGGMTALAYALMFPDEVEALVLISCATHAQPFGTAVRSLQRELIRNDPTWRGGHYYPGPGPREGMRLARKLGMISYRSPAEWTKRFDRRRLTDADSSNDPFAIEFEIEAYLDARSRAFTGGFDANSYLYLSRAEDLFDAAEHGETLADALAKVRAARALIVGVASDILFPLEQQQTLAELLANGNRQVVFKPLDSLQGHDSFLVDMERFCPAIAEFFARL
jgi:homoserine O-acetyltransferase